MGCFTLTWDLKKTNLVSEVCHHLHKGLLLSWNLKWCWRVSKLTTSPNYQLFSNLWHKAFIIFRVRCSSFLSSSLWFWSPNCFLLLRRRMQTGRHLPWDAPWHAGARCCHWKKKIYIFFSFLSIWVWRLLCAADKRCTATEINHSVRLHLAQLLQIALLLNVH